jgi:hypothetical protein
MKVTEIAAWVGAITGPSALLWDFFKWKTSGPKLVVSAWANMIKMPSPPNNPRFLKIVVQNVGTSATTITNGNFFRYRSGWRRFRWRRPVLKFMHVTRLVKLFPNSKIQAFVLATFEGPQVPYKLEVGGEWNVLMQQDEPFEAFLEDEELYFAVSHSFSRTSKEVKIIKGPR